MKIGFYFLSISLLLTFLITSCAIGKENSPVEQVNIIRQSINNNNVEELRSSSSLPLLFQEQEWASASDGYGFVLGNSKHTELSSNEEFSQHFGANIESIHIQGEQALSKDITLDLFTDELEKTREYWVSLSLYLLKRGEGDVEHIVLLGLDKKTNKLRAIYIN